MRAVLVLAALASVLFVTAPAASAAPSCGRQVIDDWYDDGRIDGSYALHCYDDAIEILPRDVRDYSSAKEDIQRALQAKLRGDDPTRRDDRSLAAGPGNDGSHGDDDHATEPRLASSDGHRRHPTAGRRRQRQLDPAPAADPRRPRAAARGGRLGRVSHPPVPEPPAPATDRPKPVPRRLRPGTLARAQFRPFQAPFRVPSDAGANVPRPLRGPQKSDLRAPYKP